jgi:hypothetical protein
MRATDFEVRHQTLLHQLLVLAAFLTYLVDRDDIVWRFIKGEAGDVRLLERAIFDISTVLFGMAAYLCTKSRVQKQASSARQRKYFGEFLYAVGLGSLAPLAGFLILVVGEGIRLLRLWPHEDSSIPQQQRTRRAAIRIEAVKWGLFFTMAVFTVMLNDRVAEILAGVSVLVWIMLSGPRLGRGRA